MMKSAVFMMSAAISGSAFGAVLNVSGMVTQTTLPPSLQLGAFESNEFARVMPERLRLLPEPQEVDITQPGLVSTTADRTVGSIPAGTLVGSFLIHADTISSNTRVFEGSVTFEFDILGIIITSTRLVNTDLRFGGEGVTYSNNGFRGIDLGSTLESDWVRLSENRRTVSFRLTVDSAMDEMRILTVPSPAAATGILAGLFVGRRRQSTSNRSITSPKSNAG
jgi:hypothetical protein